MKEFFEKNKWAAVLLAIGAVALAVFSAMRSLNLAGTKMPSQEEALKMEQGVHKQIQKELKEKYGIVPKQWGVTDTGRSDIAGTPVTPTAPSTTEKATPR
jgi:hypothetical protein